MYYIIIFAIITFIEFVIIINLLKNRTFNCDSIILKFVAKEKLSNAELNRIKKSGNMLASYIIQGMNYDWQGEYEKAYRMFLSLLAKDNIKNNEKRIINYLIALELFKGNNYKEALKYIDNVFSAFYRGNKYMKILRGKIYIYNNKFDYINTLIDNTDREYVKGFIEKAYTETDNIEILANAVKYNMLNTNGVNNLLSYYIAQKNISAIEKLVLNIKENILNEYSFSLLIKWVKLIENENDLIKKIKKSNMNKIYAKLLLIIIYQLLSDEKFEIKILIKELKQDNVYDFYKIIGCCFMEIGLYEYIKLFSGEYV